MVCQQYENSIKVNKVEYLVDYLKVSLSTALHFSSLRALHLRLLPNQGLRLRNRPEMLRRICVLNQLIMTETQTAGPLMSLIPVLEDTTTQNKITCILLL